MRSIIIQHYVPGKPGLDPNRKFEGGYPMLVLRSSENIRAYANKFGLDYALLDGTPFRNNLSYKCQKCCIINENFDDYDIVIAMDTDVFFTKNCNENITEAKGYGYSGKHQETLPRRMANMCRGYGSLDTSFWSGAVYILDRETRQRMRAIITPDMEKEFGKCDNNKVWDEGIFHILAAKVGIGKVSLDHKWNYDSYLPNPETANIIHIRHKPKSRDENYLDLVEKEII